jgi:thioredoxin-related protein
MFCCTSFPSPLRIIFVIICSLFSIAEASDLTIAINLRNEAALANHQGKPLIILYSRHQCHYCELVRRNYLRPLENKSTEDGMFVIRQINIDRDTPLHDFSGNPTTHSFFAKQQKIKLVPVVAFYGPLGQSLSAPIVGTRSADFYQNYLDDAIKVSMSRLAESQSPP